jgi:hypothetical protein
MTMGRPGDRFCIQLPALGLVALEAINPHRGTPGAG